MGNLQCVSAPMAQLNAPTCVSGQALTTTDGTTLKCVPIPSSSTDSTTENHITTTTSSVTNLQTQVTMASMGTGGAKSLYVGNTDTKSNGAITFAGAADGLPAATASCNAKYTGSHMCTVYEMYDSQVAGTIIKPGTAVPRAWVYLAGWNFPLGTPGTNTSAAPGGPQEGTSDNCGSYTYPTQHRKWTGTAVEYTTLQTGSWGLKFHGGAAANGEPGAPCNPNTTTTMLPIACCK